MLTPHELAEIMHAQSESPYDGPYGGPPSPPPRPLPSASVGPQGPPYPASSYGRRPPSAGQASRHQDHRTQPESDDNYDDDRGYDDGREDYPPPRHQSQPQGPYRPSAPASNEDERDGGYSSNEQDDSRGYEAPQRPREPERPQPVSRYRVRSPSYDNNRYRDNQGDYNRGNRQSDNFRPMDDEERYNRQGSTPVSAAGGFDAPPRGNNNNYRDNYGNRPNTRNVHPNRGTSYSYNSMHNQRMPPREGSDEEDDSRDDDNRPSHSDYGRSPSEQRQSTYGYYNSEDYTQNGNDNNNNNSNYNNPVNNNNYNNQHNNNYNGNGSNNIPHNTRNFLPNDQLDGGLNRNSNRNRKRFHFNQRN